MKNILILEDSSKVIFGGGQKVTLYVMEILHKKYSIFLADCAKESIFMKKASKYVKGKLLLKCFGKVNNKERSSFNISFQEIFFFPFLTLINLIKLKKFLNNNFLNDNIIVYAATKKSLVLAYLLKKLYGIKYIFHAHTINDKDSFFYKTISFAYKEAEKIICVSEEVSKSLEIQNKYVIYNPIDMTTISHKNIKNKKIINIATFSSLIKMKGVEYFMKSYEYLKNKKKVQFLIYGEGEQKEYLKKFEKEKIKLKGFTNKTEQLMKEEIDIIVIPSIAKEACPMVILEAFKHGIPVIATNIGGQAELVCEKCGFLVNIKKPEEIAKKIDFLIDNPEIYENYSKNALIYAQQFDMNNFEKKILKIFDESFTIR